MMRSLLTLCITLTLSFGASAEVVKMSKSGICHDSTSSYFGRTKNFTPYVTVQECLDAGGRLPKGSQINPPKNNHPTASSSKYDRKKFSHWSDDDGDCINTRHELLMKLSTSTIETGKNKCTAERGRWLDPYTGKTFYKASDLDVDHMVPLYWAWQHGADSWTDKQRKTFANDESNLFAVQASVNREKGAKGPLEWLPPDSSYHCQYVTRFKRIVLKYKLSLSNQEQSGMDTLLSQKCRK